MAWVRLDDQMPEHPKFDALSDSAFRLHIHGLCYCARQLTDGLIPKVRAHRLMDTDEVEELIWELVGAGLWEPNEAGYLIHDYLTYNPSRESIQAKRKATADRQKRFKERHGNDEVERVSNASHNGTGNAVSNGVSNASPVPSRPVPLPKGDVGGLGDEVGAVAPVVVPSPEIDERVFEILDILKQPRTENNVKYVGMKIVERSKCNPVAAALETQNHINTSRKQYKKPLVTWSNWMKNDEKPAPWEIVQTPKLPSGSTPIFPTGVSSDVLHAFQIVAAQVPADEYNAYMGDVVTSQPDSQTLLMSVPDRRKRERIQTRFMPMIVSAFMEIHSSLRPQLAS